MKMPVLKMTYLLFLLSEVVASDSVKPVITAAEGEVKAAGERVEIRQPLTTADEIVTAGDSTATISLVPGIGIKLTQKTSARILSSKVGKRSSSSEVELVRGQVFCFLISGDGESRRFRLNIGDGEYTEAIGTTWKAEREGGRKNVVVTSGTVVWRRTPGGPTIMLAAGSVLFADYETKDGVSQLVSLVVIDLISGTATQYPLEEGDAITTPATAAQLANARSELEKAVSGGFQNLTPEERASLLALLFQINKTLTQAGLGVVSAPSGRSGGSSNNPADVTSPISPL